MSSSDSLSNSQRWYRLLAGEESPLSQGDWLFAFRAFAVLMQCITLHWTKATWFVRDSTSYADCPMLPLAGWEWWPQVDVYYLLLGSMVLTLCCARLGLILQSVILFYAIIADQTRLQPEFISPVILLWATLPSHTFKTIARVHLGTMWFFAGFHKFLAPLYEKHVGQSIIIDFLKLDLPPDVAAFLGSCLPIVEIGLGLMLIFPKLRKPAAVLGCFMHLGIWDSVSGIPSAIDHLRNHRTDEAIHALNPLHWWQPTWEWNLTLAAASIIFLWNWQTKLNLDWQRSRWPLRIAIAVLVVSPFTYYLGWIHPYLSHCLLSGNTAFAEVLPREQQNIPVEQRKYQLLIPSVVTDKLGLSIPPSAPTLLQYFEKTARNGDMLFLSYPRSMKKLTSLNDLEITHGSIDGKQQGYWLLYDNASKKIAEGNYQNGLKQGTWIQWRSDGNKEAEGLMLDDKQHGRWLYYHDDGISFDEFYFDRGKQIAAPM